MQVAVTATSGSCQILRVSLTYGPSKGWVGGWVGWGVVGWGAGLYRWALAASGRGVAGAGAAAAPAAALPRPPGSPSSSPPRCTHSPSWVSCGYKVGVAWSGAGWGGWGVSGGLGVGGHTEQWLSEQAPAPAPAHAPEDVEGVLEGEDVHGDGLACARGWPALRRCTACGRHASGSAGAAHRPAAKVGSQAPAPRVRTPAPAGASHPPAPLASAAPAPPWPPVPRRWPPGRC